jgi:signal transduction histidine kinase
MKQTEKAYSWYKFVLVNFNGELSSSGIPFSYLAISQLIKLQLPGKQNEIVALAEIFIKQLAENEIPLTPGTQTILDDLSRWFSTVQLQESQQKKVSALIENINFKLGFISVYSNEIREITVSGRKSELPAISGKYPGFAMNVNENPELLVISAESETIAGFVVSLNDLWSDVTSQLPESKDFEYAVDLVSGSVPVKPDELAVRAELSPYFPLHRIVIKPANEELVEKFVRKRSWTYGIALVLLLGGMSLGIVLILRDIKRDKKMADMQSEFVSHVTHELKTPLTSINMFAETIFLDRAKSEEIRKKYANIIMKESEVLKRKIDNILEYSVRKNETAKYRIKETNLTVLVVEVMDEMKYWLDINQFEVQTDIEAGIFAQVDPEAIKQALTNLIGNAIKYSSVEKRLVVCLKKQVDKIKVEVEDSGLGIPADQVDLIFEKFYRIRSHENDSTTGTGLGLSVTRDIVQAHGGKILVESEINKGSKFTIQLPSC